MTAPSQQFRPVGPGISPSNVGMQAIQSQPMQFSHQIHQFPLMPGQPVHSSMPSSQAIPSQHAVPAMNNHLTSLSSPGITPSSYTVRHHSLMLTCLSCWLGLYLFSLFIIISYGFVLANHKILYIYHPSFNQCLKCMHL